MQIKLSPVAFALLLALGAAACSSSGDRSPGASEEPAAAPTTAPASSADAAQPGAGAADISRARVRLSQVAELSSPVGMTIRKGDAAIYVIEQGGQVRAIRNGRLDSAPVLDISSLIGSGGERGLLGIAFSPDGRYLYLDYTDTQGDTHVAEFTMSGGRPDPRSQRDLLTVDQPYPNHNGGQLAFGPDGYLYIALGDGGSAGDPHGNGQSLRALLGKILRISPRPSGGRPYGIPRDNPFVGRSGARPEIWDYGLRNPWRFSFDPATGDLWIADVGQGEWEEIDHEPAGRGGRNYGWNALEGSHPYSGERPPGTVAPVIEYSHQEGGCTVIGGSVYRGRAIRDLVGGYLYGDYCAGWIRAAPVRGAGVGESRDLGIKVPNLTSFGVDQRGELYALSQGGPVYRIVPG